MRIVVSCLEFSSVATGELALVCWVSLLYLYVADCILLWCFNPLLLATKHGGATLSTFFYRQEMWCDDSEGSVQRSLTRFGCVVAVVACFGRKSQSLLLPYRIIVR